jgi:nuclear transport factor 2 (NTF2) superfamily protein
MYTSEKQYRKGVEKHKFKANNCGLILYVFWVFPRRQIVFFRRFGTLCQVHHQRLGVEYEYSFEDEHDRMFRNVGKTQYDAENTQKNIYNIQNTTKV